MTSGRPAVATLLAAVLALAAQPLATAATAAPAAAESGAPSAGVAKAQQPGAGGAAYRLTLLTGDVVALHIGADGKQSAWVDRAATRGRPARIYQQDGDVHVVP